MTNTLTATTESLLIVRLKLKSLLQDEEWEEAAAVGMSGLRAAAAAPPSESNNEETTQIATALADLGLLVDADVVSRFLCGAHSCGQLAQPLLREATVALKRLKGHDVEAWSRGILNGGAMDGGAMNGGAKLETMDAALQLLDTATSHVVVSHPTFQSTIQRELCSPEEARRAGALQVIGTAVLTTPALAVPLLPVLVRAVFVETTPLKQAALANVLDAAFALARLPPPPAAAEGSDEQQLFGSLMQWLPQMLSAPLKGLQTLAALGLAKLVLHRKEASLLCACTDPEHLIAQLGRRYTACDQPRTDLAASTHVPDPMPILLAFFEELKARRQDDLGNTVASGLRWHNAWHTLLRSWRATGCSHTATGCVCALLQGCALHRCHTLIVRTAGLVDGARCAGGQAATPRDRRGDTPMCKVSLCVCRPRQLRRRHRRHLHERRERAEPYPLAGRSRRMAGESSGGP